MRQNSVNRQDLTLEYQSFAEAVVRKLMSSLSLPQENFDEYFSAGLLGLVEAADRFDPGNGSDFRAFAFLRIRGAVIDSIRDSSELSGRAYRYAKALQAAHATREVSELCPTNDTKERFAKVLETAASGALALRLSFQDAEQELLEIEDGSTGEEVLMTRQSRAFFKRLVSKLPEKERMIVEEFYFNDKSFGEILAENEGLSKSWLSRLHTRALEKLKELYEAESE